MSTPSKSRRASLKKQYRIRNWPLYNEALVQRGSLEIWISEEAFEYWQAEPSHKQGGQKVYSDLAITTVLTVQKLYHLPLRAVEGLVTSIFHLTNTTLKTPDYSTLSRRGATLIVPLNKKQKEKVTIIVDGSGAKVFGEGEWKVRQHGYSKRRKWKKIHIAIDKDGEIRAEEMTDNSVHDSEAVPTLLLGEEAVIETFAGDGAYDTRTVYDECCERGIERILVPPQVNAKIWFHGNRTDARHPRDENLRAIRRLGRAGWKQESGYHIRSKVENVFFRLKTIFGERLRSREDHRQATEARIMCAALNRMLSLGMPASYALT
jgi:hypothetical protein